MPSPQPALLASLATHQWYVHLSRTEGADLELIKQALRDLLEDTKPDGVQTLVNVGLFFGPTLLADLTDDIPEDFQPYPGYESPDGKVAKGTQEELLVWLHSEHKDLNWASQLRSLCSEWSQTRSSSWVALATLPSGDS